MAEMFASFQPRWLQRADGPSTLCLRYGVSESAQPEKPAHRLVRVRDPDGERIHTLKAAY